MQNKKIKLLRQFVTSYSPVDFFHRYELFKFVVLVFLVGIFTSIGISAFQMRMLASNFSPTQFFTLYMGIFLPRFWLLYNKWTLLCVVLFFLALRFRFSKRFFLNKIEFIITPKLLDPVVARIFKVINNWLTYLLTAYIIMAGGPLLHLYNLNLYTVLIALVTLIVPFVYNNYRLLTRKKNNYEYPLSKHTFLDISYKSASGGPLSEEMKEELRRYRKIKTDAPVGTDALNFAAQSKDNKFKGFSDLFNQLEVIFDPNRDDSGNVADKICLHNKTSDAIAHVLELVTGPDDPNGTEVIFSDAEYLRIKDTLRSFSGDNAKIPAGAMPGQRLTHEVKVEKYLLNDTYSEEKYSHGVIKKLMALHKANPAALRFCIVLTHVYHQTGRVVQIKLLISRLNEQAKTYKEQYAKQVLDNYAKGMADVKMRFDEKKIDESAKVTEEMKLADERNAGLTQASFKMVYIVDGAQAVGNICMTNDVLDACHFYAVCGHKWLLGQYSMGILLRNDKLITDDEIKLHESAADIAGERQVSNRHHMAKSIPYEPYISTSIMLSDINHHGMALIEEHNRCLAKSFVMGLYELNNIYKVVNDDCDCGIVTIIVNKGQTAADVNALLIDRYSISGDIFEQEEGGEDKSMLLRFSFHYFMGENDVNKLLYALLDVSYKD